MRANSHVSMRSFTVLGVFFAAPAFRPHTALPGFLHLSGVPNLERVFINIGLAQAASTNKSRSHLERKKVRNDIFGSSSLALTSL